MVVPIDEYRRLRAPERRASTQDLDAAEAGRRMYETMRSWETAHTVANQPPVALDFARIWQAVTEEGFRESRTGEPPDEHHIGWAVHETSNLCPALGLLAVGGDWRDRSYGLTGTGQATALAALRARATGPRAIPWP